MTGAKDTPEDWISPWDVDPRELGKVVDESLRELVNCWVRNKAPTQEQANDVNKARMALGYLVTRAKEVTSERE